MSAPVDLRPGKIIAIHLNYPSRIAQRGRTPAYPSYFLKPTTSAAASGGVVERPAGTELLAFEGEIALVIGRSTRCVTPQEAWGHVAGVTAANDLGVYDLRAADRGSNLRSKGGDGFTPLGPSVLPAADLDPRSLRVRTWVNGDLVQEDNSSTLVFPLTQLVADLSQLITLEAGDVILTGTPAGSSVVSPGDVIEVEVDAPLVKRSTGRLVTTVTQGSTPLPAYGAQPEVDDDLRALAWGTPDQASTSQGNSAPVPGLASTPVAGLASTPVAGLTSAPGSAPVPEASVLTDELRTLLASVAVATLSVELRRLGFNDSTIDGVRPSRPGSRVVGLARTLRFVPFRPDLFASHGGGMNAQKRAVESLQPGDVLVIEARGEPGTGTLGDVLAMRAQVRGAAGVVTDGGIRDAAAVSALDLPTWSAGPHPAVLGRRHVPWEVDVTIACGGTTVQPGDVIVGDDDGVVVIPAALVKQVALAAVEHEREDAFVFEQVRTGASIDGLFPMNTLWRTRYDQWRAEQ